MPRSTALAPRSSISQLDRLLRALPEQAGGTPGRPELERACRVHHEWDGWVRGTFCLPADEGALVPGGLIAARDAELRDRHDVDPADPAPPAAAEATAAVSWADGLVRPAVEATDALDPTVRRTGHRGHRGQRALVVLHHDVEPGGHLGAAQLDLGPVVPDAVARYLSCDARVQVVSHRAGRLVGIDLTERTVSPAMRRYLARRDQGCVHPLCAQRRWLHAHHLCTPTTWSTGPLAVAPRPATSPCSAPATTGLSTMAISASTATRRPAPSRPTTAGAAPSARPPSGADRPHGFTWS
ncbi:MAG TPA: DUF222 domain-containing protein [Acidimicrobiales bacterium]|nr:DUF222 domain-containing protein [Acidimicrobiales bacterium]